tara:strand:+ start:124 stop:981 length:858 start_codon:yes stop_codon:yes gene_type:complete
MKNFKNSTLVGFILILLSVSSCDNDSDSISATQIDTSTPILSNLDIWLRNEFVAPFNIEIAYLWNPNNVDIARFLYPIQENNVQRWSQTILDVWAKPYNQLGGEDFIANLAPRQFVYSGGFNFNPNSPTITLGVAEAGARITFFNLDFLDYTNANSIRQPLQTLHHEYGHILNQTVPFTDDFGQITPADYTAQWFNLSDQEALDSGFITPYASSKEDEDFVEILANMLTSTQTEFDARVSSASPEGQAFIREKQQMVVDYFQTNFSIDLFELQILTNEALIAALD